MFKTYILLIRNLMYTNYTTTLLASQIQVIFWKPSLHVKTTNMTQHDIINY